jgi:hypothetical protein
VKEEDCGCVSDDIYWMLLCSAHRKETRATEARWAADHHRPIKITKLYRNGRLIENPQVSA